MKVSRDKIESVIRKRYAGDSIVTERQIEGMIAKVHARRIFTKRVAIGG